jgi:hypothetical protein
VGNNRNEVPGGGQEVQEYPAAVDGDTATRAGSKCSLTVDEKRPQEGAGAIGISGRIGRDTAIGPGSKCATIEEKRSHKGSRS